MGETEERRAVVYIRNNRAVEEGGNVKRVAF